ncbi:MAG: TonB-dependent receptor [Longimicrobiales bacterium]
MTWNCRSASVLEQIRTMSLRGRTAAAVLAISLVAPASGEAQTGSQRQGAKKVIALEELVVSATRTNQTVGTLPANVTVLTRDQIELSAARSLPDLLRTLPGLTFADYQSATAGHPSRQSPAMRGLGGTTSSRALVLVDGVPLDDPFTGWVAWARVPLDLVERVEVVRGGGAGIWGSRAMGGVINIITVSPVASAAQLTLRGGSQSTRAASGSLSRVNGRFAVTAAAEYSDTDGFFVVPEAIRGPIDIPAGTRHGVAFARLRYNFAPTFTVHLNGDWFDEHRRNATHLGRISTEIGQVNAGARLRHGDHRWSLDAYAVTKNGNNFASSDSDDRLTETPTIDQYDTPASALGMNIQWSRQLLAAHEITVGGDVLRSAGELYERTRYVAGEFTRLRRSAGLQWNRSVYVQDVFTPSPAWRIVLASRFDRWSNRDGERGETDIATGDVLVDSRHAARSESHLSYTLAVRQGAAQNLSWRASLYSSFRAPTLNELYRAARASGGIVLEPGPDLEAERLTGTEAGIDFTPDSRVLIRTTAFWARLDHPIIEVTLGVAGSTGQTIEPCGFVSRNGTCRQRRNLGASESYGLESEIEVRPGARWTFALSHTWNQTEFTAAPGQEHLIGKSNRGQPEHTLTARARWADSRIADFSLSGRYVGERFDDDLNTLVLESFFTADLRAARRLTAHWELFTALENVFNTEYAVNRAPDGTYRISGPRRFEAGLKGRW